MRTGKVVLGMEEVEGGKQDVREFKCKVEVEADEKCQTLGKWDVRLGGG